MFGAGDSQPFVHPASEHFIINEFEFKFNMARLMQYTFAINEEKNHDHTSVVSESHHP